MVKRVMKTNVAVSFVVFALAIFGLSGCESTNSAADFGAGTANDGAVGIKGPGGETLIDTLDWALEVVGEPVAEKKSGYVLKVGDVLDVKFFYSPELNETVRIRPDGRISLQLVDEVAAAGLTATELDDLLTKKYSRILRRPDIAVIVREYAEQRVYIGGEVQSPGVIAISHKLTSLQAIFEAGGFKRTAEQRKVVILRNQGTEEPLFISVDLKPVLETGNISKDIVLRPYDIVFVPRTGIAKMGDFVNQYINQLVPAALTFGLVYNLNPEMEVK